MHEQSYRQNVPILKKDISQALRPSRTILSTNLSRDLIISLTQVERSKGDGDCWRESIKNFALWLVNFEDRNPTDFEFSHQASSIPFILTNFNWFLDIYGREPSLLYRWWCKPKELDEVCLLRPARSRTKLGSGTTGMFFVLRGHARNNRGYGVKGVVQWRI